MLAALRPKICSYLTDDGCFNKKVKDIKMCVIKREIKFQVYKECLKSQRKFRSEAHNVFTKKVNKIVLSANDERMQTPDGVISYAYGAGPERVRK